ncbi:MAG: hypothetical protein NVS4B6_09420 [Mycobacterium sp.]
MEIELEVDGGIAGATIADAALDFGSCLGDLGFHARQMLLATEAGINGHHQQQVNQMEDIRHRVERCGRIQRDAYPGAEIGDGCERAMQVSSRLRVHDNEFAARLDPPRQHRIRILYHEVRLKADRDMATVSGDHVRSERQIRYEPPVHDIPLDPINAGLLQLLDLLAEF